MRVSNIIQECVVYICYYNFEKEDYIPVGTGTLLSDTDIKNYPTYVLTAKHILKEVKKKGIDEIIIKLNTKDSLFGIIKTNIQDWVEHKDSNVDITMLPISWSIEINQKVFPKKLGLNKCDFTEYNIGLGDEVFITGLFHYHYGKTRNLPITRIGNISYLGEENITTKEHVMEGILIECRSIGGVSGSPVFVNLGQHRIINGKLQTNNSESIPLLLGIVYGHYDQSTDKKNDILNEDREKINTGIAIITPFWKVLEMFSYQKIIKHKNKIKKGEFDSKLQFFLKN